MTRECGPCTACCTIVYVPELDKKAGSLCALCTGSGCHVYKQRPPSCKKFECEWIKGYLPDDMRPDLSGVMVEKLPLASTMLVSPVPGSQDRPWETERVSTVLRDLYLDRGMAVVARDGDELTVLLPEGRLQESVDDDLERAGIAGGI